MSEFLIVATVSSVTLAGVLICLLLGTVRHERGRMINDFASRMDAALALSFCRDREPQPGAQFLGSHL